MAQSPCGHTNRRRGSAGRTRHLGDRAQQRQHAGPLGLSPQRPKAGAKVTAYVNPGTEDNTIGLCQRIVLEDGTVIFVRGANID